MNFFSLRAKHPQVNPPPIPPVPTPPPVQVSGGDIVRALRSFPSDSAPGPSNFRASHFKEAVLCLSPDQANYALQGLLGVVNPFSVVGVLLPKWSLTCVVPPSLLAERKEVGSVPLLLGKCYAVSFQSASLEQSGLRPLGSCPLFRLVLGFPPDVRLLFILSLVFWRTPVFLQMNVVFFSSISPMPSILWIGMGCSMR